METPERKGPGREVIAARQLIEEWARKLGLKTYDTPRSAYMDFCEWLYAKIIPKESFQGNAFEMEVFRRMLPRYDVFQMVLSYVERERLPREAKA